MIVIAGCYWKKILPTLRNHGRGQQVRAGVNTESGCLYSLSLIGPGELEPVLTPALQPPWASQGVYSLKFGTGSCSPVALSQLHRGMDDGICLLWGCSEQKLIWGMLNKDKMGFTSWMKSQVWTGSSEWGQLWGREYFFVYYWVSLCVLSVGRFEGFWITN